MAGQGLPGGHADQIRLRARKTYRFHLLHRRRGVGILRHDGRADAFLPADPAPDAHGRAAGGAFRTHLLLCGGGDSALSPARERGNDHRADARDGYSPSVHELWRLVAHRFHDPALYRREARRLDPAVQLSITLKPL